jgi:hypothetical protein
LLVINRPPCPPRAIEPEPRVDRGIEQSTKKLMVTKIAETMTR